MARYLQNLNLIKVLDDLRDVYELARDLQHPGLQSRVMEARRTLIAALHESLNLHGENADLQEQLAEAEAENARLRASGCEPAPRVSVPARGLPTSG